MLYIKKHAILRNIKKHAFYCIAGFYSEEFNLSNAKFKFHINFCAVKKIINHTAVHGLLLTTKLPVCMKLV